jgi:hypothetical protein
MCVGRGLGYMPLVIDDEGRAVAVEVIAEPVVVPAIWKCRGLTSGLTLSLTV